MQANGQQVSQSQGNYQGGLTAGDTWHGGGKPQPYQFPMQPQLPAQQWYPAPAAAMDWETRQELALLKASLHEAHQKLDAILTALGLRDRRDDAEDETETN